MYVLAQCDVLGRRAYGKAAFDNLTTTRDVSERKLVAQADRLAQEDLERMPARHTHMHCLSGLKIRQGSSHVVPVIEY